MTLESLKNHPWVRRAFWAAVAILVVWAVAWAVLPGLLKSQLTRLGGEQLGREVRIGAVSLRPWSLELTLEDLAVAGPPGTAPQLTIQRIYLDAELQSLLRLAPVVDALQVDGLALRLTHLGGGHYDVDDLLTRWLAPAEPPKPATALPRFALYNLAVRSASVDFVDQGVGQTHEVRDLQLSIPFLSNLGAKREVLTEPRLSFRLNGSRFDSSAQTVPFVPTHKTDVALKLADLDLRPYLAYLPPDLPVKLRAGVVGGDVRLHFEQTPQPMVRLSGTIDLKGLALADVQGQDLLALQALRVDMADVRPLEQVVQLSAVELTGPRLEVRRDRAGVLNLLHLAQAGRKPAAAGEASVKAAEPSVWQVSVAKAAVRAGQVRWSDAAVQPAARIELNDVMLDATGLVLPLRQPAGFNGSLRLTQAGGNGAAAAPAGARLSFKGEASEQAATISAELQDLSLALAAPYAAQFLQPALAGRLDAEVAGQWQEGQWQLRLPSLVLRQLMLGAPGRSARGEVTSPPLAIDRLELRNAEVSPAERSVTLGQLAIRQPAVTVERDKDGRWMFERWLRGDAPAAGPASSSLPTTRPAAASAPVDKPAAAWRLMVADVALDGGRVRYTDRAQGRPVVLDVAALSLQAKNFASNGAKPQPIKLSAQVRARRGEPGRLSFGGALALQPLSVFGQLQATDLPTHALSPYLGNVLNVGLVRADAGFKGQARYAQTPHGDVLRLRGDVLLEDVLAHTVAVAGQTQDMPVGEELLSWKALSLRGLDVALQPGQATRVSVAETALSDFYARVLINERGRINLQDLVKSKPAEVPAAAEPAPTLAAAAAGPAPAAPAPVVAMGPVSLVNGRVEFSDRFIKPNYSARLSELTGRLSAFASQPASGAEPGAAPAMADLELRGRAEGTATIEILGKLNPLAQPLALDITGKMRDLELSPLSPYSVKYAGHGIERGKLSMDVSYKVQPDGQLVANNKLVLNQLTFGDPVEGAPNSLPVRLAVALLADRDGVIDINLPISGSLNDPEFSVGAIVWKMIVNLIAKAITAPFALLASAFDGGDEELGTVPFAPGSAALSAAARAGLDKVAQAMKSRAGLTLTVAGTASLEAERDGYKRERLAALILAEKRRAAVVAGQPAESVASVTAEERPALLRQVYRRAQMAKPRNLLGLTKELPPAEMEALLLANIQATEEHMRELALARGVAVRDYLSTRELPLDRLFLGAAKAEATDARWVPHAELSLTMK